MKRLFAALIVALLGLPAVTAAQGLVAVARLDPDRSGFVQRPGGVDLALTISQPVPYRVTLLDSPPRLVLDFREVDFSRLRPGALGTSPVVHSVVHGAIQTGWSRMVVELAGPYAVETAAMRTGAADGSARIEIALRETDPTTFATRVALPGEKKRPDAPTSVVSPAPEQAEDGRLTVVLDPGHGGIDPGAVRGDAREADLVLAFALELREALLRAGGFDVALTRSGDEFVSLEGRIDAARRAGGEVLLSLHADAVSEGFARGAQFYTLSDEASSAASAKLAERHDRADLLAGVDLSGHDDEIARVLMSIARTETAPRTEALAQSLVDGFAAAGVKLHKRPLEQAAFSVLKAPDIPAVLIELGFMSSPSELEKLEDPEWRSRAAAAVVSALRAWDEADRARAALHRR